MKRTIALLFIILALILVACGGQEATPEPTEAPAVQAEPTVAPPTAVPPTEVPPTAIPPTEEPAPTGVAGMEHVADPALVDITWEWVRRAPNGTEFAELYIPNPENYTLLFNADGTFSAQVDCNNAAGMYATPAAGSILMELGPMTLAACEPGSLADDMMALFGPAQAYGFEEDGNLLVLNWVDNGPVDYFRNAAAEVAGEEEVQGIPEDAIQLDLNGLATSFDWQVMPGSPVPQQGPGGYGFPPHIVLTFDGADPNVAPGDPDVPRLYIFPAAAYVKLYNDAGNEQVAGQVARLEELIATADGRSELPESPMPLLPPAQSFMDRWAQFQDLNFAAGDGVRYVSDSPFRQANGVWTSSSTGYYYQGLTSDKTFYVSLYWPVATAALPANEEDASVEQIEAATNPDTYPAYLQETKDALNALTPADWTPDLAALDAMVASLSFPLPGEVPPAEGDGEEVDLPAPDTGEPTAVVNAPDGIFIRSGPGTNYPDIGVAAFGDSGTITGVSEDGEWWVIEVPVGVSPDGQGWISATWVDASNTEGVPVVPAPDQQPSLAGVTWQWVSTTSPAGVTTVADPTLYTITFNTDGTAQIKADCNNILAEYTATDGSLSLLLGPSTLVFCGEESQDQDFRTGLESAAAYFFEAGDLYIDMMADAGTMRFTAAGAPAAPQPSLTGPTWQWVSTTTPAEVITVDNPTVYTILFNEDGTAAIKADCNNVGASYTISDSSLTIQLGPSTLAFCGEASLDQQFLTGLQSAAIYSFQEGDLFIDMAADAGTMRFTAGDAVVETPESPTSPAQGVLFNLVSYGPEGAEQTVIEGTQITATFSEQQVSGNAGCNDYTGLVTPVEDHFTISGVATTRKLCGEPAGIMEQEAAYLAALQGTAGYQWEQSVVDNVGVVTAGRLLYFLADGTSGYLNFIAQ